MGTSTIEWTDKVWNPVTGCTQVGEGCRNCYAKRRSVRLAATPAVKHRERYEGFKVHCWPERLDEPLHWRKPCLVFPCSMGDLFHKDVPDDFIARVFDVMWKCSQHTFMVLTKRFDRCVSWVSENAKCRGFGWTDRDREPITPGVRGAWHMDDIRMRNVCGYIGDEDDGKECLHPESDDGSCDCRSCPIAYCVDTRKGLRELDLENEHEYDDEGLTDTSEWMEFSERPRNAMAGNVRLGFSAWDQNSFVAGARAWQRLRGELGPYATLFCSLEPLLGPIQMRMPHWPDGTEPNWSPLETHDYSDGSGQLHVPTLNWVIVGGETGPGARPMHPLWARSVRNQCAVAGVPFFFKSWGDCLRIKSAKHIGPCNPWRFRAEVYDGRVFEPVSLVHNATGIRVGKKTAGRLLDGVEWNEVPHA